MGLVQPCALPCLVQALPESVVRRMHVAGGDAMPTLAAYVTRNSFHQAMISDIGPHQFYVQWFS